MIWQKSKLYSCLSVLFLLLYFLPSLSLASTTLNTPITIIANSSGTSTGTSITLDTSSSITINNNDNYHIMASLTSSGAMTSPPNITWGGSGIISFGGTSTLNYTVDCDIFPDFTGGVHSFVYFCRKFDATTITQTAGTVNLSGTNTWQFVTSASSSRTFSWNWTIARTTGGTPTTTITEEDNLGCASFSCLTGTSGVVLTSGSYNNPTWITGLDWSKIASRPSTLSGYGIIDAYPLSGNPSGFLTSIGSITWSSITGTPTTLGGYGITDGVNNTGTYTNPSWLTLTNFVPTSRTITIDGTSLDLSADRSWTTTGGGGGCTDFSCLTGTNGIIIYDENTLYGFVLGFLLITFLLTSFLTYKILKKTL